MRTQTFAIKAGGRTVHGTAYLPDGQSGKIPFVIFSHGYNGSQTDLKKYAEYFALRGIGGVCFTFCGGSVRDKESGLETTEMTLLTEKEDLLAVLAYVFQRADSDGSNIFLAGGSQGGVVTALAAEEARERVRAVVLVYPAFCMWENWEGRYPLGSEIPERTELWGMSLGRGFFETIRKIKYPKAIGGYKGAVYLLHGTKDPIVPLAYSEQAKSLYQNAALEVLEGEGHGFSEAGANIAAEKIFGFISSQIV